MCPTISLRNSILTERGGGGDIIAALFKCSAVITSTLKDCSSAFTAHKIHSSNWPLSVHRQQLCRHLRPRSVTKTMVPLRSARKRRSLPLLFLLLSSSPPSAVQQDAGAEQSYAFGGHIASESLVRSGKQRSAEPG